MSTKTIPDLSTIGRMLDELDKAYSALHRLRSKLPETRMSADEEEKILADIHVQVTILKSKAETACAALDQYQEFLPDD